MAQITITVDDVLTRFPQFDGKDDQIEFLIPEAARLVADTWNEDDQRSALLYLVAHLLVSEDSADAYPVTSESLGPISVSYAVPSNATLDPFRNTEFGRRYLDIRRRQIGASVVVINGR